MADIQPASGTASWPDWAIVFPWWVVGSSDSILKRNARRTSLPHSSSYVFNLTGIMLTASQAEQLELFFDAVQHEHDLFLFLDETDHELHNEILGVGDGSTTTFQLAQTHRSCNAKSVSQTRAIRCPNHLYPPNRDLYGNLMMPTQTLSITIGDAEATDWTVDRQNSGLIILAEPAPEGAEVRCAKGSFFHLVRLNVRRIEVRPIAIDCYQVVGEVQLRETM
jgi:hypothetical protein